MILDLFAGPGGWDEGLRSIGITDVIGLEWDAAACATRAAAGHRTIRCDVAQYPPDPFVGKVRGLIASPPCQAWSMAGKGHGRAEVDRVHEAVEACRGGWTDTARGGEWLDERTPLILEPLRWAWAIRPLWIACEQVPPALGVWKHMADVLRSWGYRADVRVLCAADYGVPQTRYRAILIAHRERLAWPEPTHAEKPEPSLFGGGQLPWVTMAEALGWAGIVPGALSVRTSFGEPHRGKEAGSPKPEFDPHERPSRTINTKTGDWQVQFNPGRTNTQPNRRLYGLNEPAPTIGFGHDSGNWRWVFSRPSTTVVGAFSPHIIAAPGHQDINTSRQDMPGSVQVEIHEAGVLQGFPADYPWQGSKTAVFRQVGDAVPPPMAAAIIGALEGVRAGREAVEERTVITYPTDRRER